MDIDYKLEVSNNRYIIQSHLIRSKCELEQLYEYLNSVIVRDGNYDPIIERLNMLRDFIEGIDELLEMGE